MKVLVTGASGFIGRYVIQSLLQKGDIEILATTRDIKKASSLSFFNSVKFIELDISSLDKDFPKIIGSVDALIHLAWDGLPNYKEPFHYEKNLFENYFFCKQMLDSGLKNLTVIGTCFEYGMIDGRLCEDFFPKPNNAYAIAKDSLRKFIEQLALKKSFSFKWLRLFYMYGEGQAKNSLISQLDRAIVNGDKEFNMSGGEQIRDYLHVTEVADYIVRCSLQIKVDGVINCCSGKPISIRNFVESYLKQKQVEIKLNLGYYPYADYEPLAFWGDNSKLLSILNS